MLLKIDPQRVNEGSEYVVDVQRQGTQSLAPYEKTVTLNMMQEDP